MRPTVFEASDQDERCNREAPVPDGNAEVQLNEFLGTVVSHPTSPAGVVDLEDRR
jgi:hypothetical protein